MSRTQVGTRLLGAGAVLQTVFASISTQVVSSVIMDTAGVPVSTEGVEVITATITPKSATSILRVEYGGVASTSGSAINACHAIFRDSDANALTARAVTITSGTYIHDVEMSWDVVSGSVAPTTFKVRVGPASATTIYINGNSGALFGGVGHTTLAVTEIAA